MKHWQLHLGRYALPYWRSFLAIQLLLLATAGLEALKPWPFKLVLDYIIPARPFPPSMQWLVQLPGAATVLGILIWVTSGMVLIFLANWCARILQSYLQSGATARMVYDLAADVFEHIQALTLRYHGRQRTGDLTQRIIADTGCVRDLVLNVVIPALTALFTLAFMFWLMLLLDPGLCLLTLVAAPLLYLLIRYFAQPLQERTYAQYAAQGEMMAAAEQTLTSMAMVQTLGAEPYEQMRFGTVLERAGVAYRQAIGTQLHFKIATGVVTAACTALIMALGGYHALAGQLTVGNLYIFLSYLVALYTPMESLAYISQSYAAAAAGARRTREVLAAGDIVREKPNAETLPATTPGDLKFEHVTFAYEPGRPVLHNIDLYIQPGESVAIVGETGSGKSTLAALIPRLFDPVSGAITYHGVDLRDLKLESLRSQFATIPQEALLLPMTIAQNIAYGRPEATPEEIQAAAVAAGADAFIQRLPEGYNAMIGERGCTLSGGERQRLAIARAFLKNAPILILDEPTSALDATTEAALLDSLEQLMVGRTTIMITHRLSALRAATRVIVLADGRIAENGTPQLLMAANGPFSRLCASGGITFATKEAAACGN